MNRLSFCWFLLLAVLWPATHSAAETVPTSVRELIVLGLEKNIGLQVERLNIPVATEAVTINEALFDAELFAATEFLQSATPLASSLSLTGQSESAELSGAIGLRKKYNFGLLAAVSLSSEWTDDNSLSEDLDPRYRSALTLSLTQPLLRDFGEETNSTSLRIARNQRSQSELRLLLQGQALALQIELFSSRLAGESKIVELRSEAVALAKELYSANQRRFDAGVIPVSEVQEAETALADRELSLSLAQQTKELNFADLNRQLNHVLTEEFAADSLYPFSAELADLELAAPPQLFTAARDKSLQLQLATIDIGISSLQQGFFQNQLRPQLDLTVLAGLNGLAGDEHTSSLGKRYAGSWSDSFASAAEADGYQWGAGLEFSVPLGNRSAKSKLRQAELQHRQAQYRQRDLETELRSALQQQTINLRRAFQQVKIAERFEALARLSLQQEQRRLEEGLSDTFRIISFQDKMISARIGRVNALIQYFSSVAQMNFTRGVILERHNIKLSQNLEENSLEAM